MPKRLINLPGTPVLEERKNSHIALMEHSINNSNRQLDRHDHDRYYMNHHGTSQTSFDNGNMYRPAPYTPNEYPVDNQPYSNSQQIRLTTPRLAGTNIIRVINKDMTAQFRGRAHSVSQARIRWLENRKSQLMGCCLTMAFLGLTISLFKFRWIGLIAGSVNTIICGMAVVITYFRKHHWHQHPNPIVHIRAVLGVCFAFCLLLNIAVNFKPGHVDKEKNCQRLAGVTEFFFFTSEAWGLVMACDLFFSLTSPFTSYKRLMRFYHLWVWLGGFVMAMNAGLVHAAGGFFTVDGQAIEFGADQDSLVGFCLASSSVCCDPGKQTCPPEFSTCESNTFLSTQKWYDFLLDERY